jgi:hypothetical protein
MVDPSASVSSPMAPISSLLNSPRPYRRVLSSATHAYTPLSCRSITCAHTVRAGW